MNLFRAVSRCCGRVGIQSRSQWIPRPIPDAFRSSRGFHFSSPNSLHPLFFTVVIKSAKLFSIVVGRGVRKWRLSQLDGRRWHHVIFEAMDRHKRKLIAGVGVGFGLSALYVANHVNRNPHTGRLQFITFTDKQIDDICRLQLEELAKTYKNGFIKISDSRYKSTDRILRRLIESNQSVTSSINFSLNLIHDCTPNAFVFPNGVIFVSTGMLALVKNEHQLAWILGHEMSHAILGHSNAMLSTGQLLDAVMSVCLVTVWTFLPSAFWAACAHLVADRFAKYYVNLPYSRFQEIEADSFGMKMMAKACFDVRESATVWSEGTTSFDIHSFFSTHPSDKERRIRFDHMMPKYIQMREDCNCPPLVTRDPLVKSG